MGASAFHGDYRLQRRRGLPGGAQRRLIDLLAGKLQKLRHFAGMRGRNYLACTSLKAPVLWESNVTSLE
jgi:hypothetical protein